MLANKIVHFVLKAASITLILKEASKEFYAEE